MDRMSETDLRHKVEVLIYNDEKKFCIAHPLPEKNFYTIPGGGIDKGETLFEAAKRESMEEVGIEIFRLDDLNFSRIFVSKTVPTIAKKEGFRGGKSHYVLAKFKKMNKSILGADNDQREWSWYTLTEAKKLLSDNEFDLARIEAMELSIGRMTK